MPKVTFKKDFDWSPSRYQGRVTMAFKAGTHQLVTREAAEAAKKAGALEDDESR